MKAKKESNRDMTSLSPALTSARIAQIGHTAKAAGTFIRISVVEDDE